MSLIATGDYMGAARIMLRDNPLSGICGRVCTHPCERRCRRGTVDEAMNICELKRFATDWAYNQGFPTDEDLKPIAKLDKRVAIIGAGPSGLTCGYYLARLGYQVDIYEAERRAGGVMTYGIPDYRLPLNILEREINHIERAGVNIILNTKIGDDISFRSVYENYDAVFIAIGAQKTLHMGIPGEEELEGVYHGLDFLKRRFLQNDLDFTGKKVAVIGGGNTAIDSARTAVRLGAEKVSIIYRRTREDMPADKVEIKDALEEGVEIRTLLNPVELIGENGKLKSIRIMKQNLGQFDSSGRRKAVSSGESFVEDFDRIVADKYTQATSLPGVFVGGDAHRGPEDIVNAVHEAKVAVMGIDKYLGGKGELYKGFEQEITDYHIEGDIIPHNRFLTRQLGVEEAVGSFRERNLGMHELDARAEASRCLRCDRR